jgi:hypothetical protein
MLGVVESAGEHDVELVERDFPVVGGTSTLATLGGASHITAAEVEQLDQGLVGREVSSGFVILRSW